MYDRRKIKNSVRGTGSVKPRSPVQRFVGGRRAVFGSFEDTVKGGKAVEAGLHGHLGDGKIGRKQQPFRIGDSSADEVFIAGHAGKLLEQPGKMILAEARPGRQLFNAQIFRAVVIDIGTDGHEFFYIFLLFAGGNVRELIPFGHITASESHKKRRNRE